MNYITHMRARSQELNLITPHDNMITKKTMVVKFYFRSI